MWGELRADVRAVMDRDPAARNKAEVILIYPSVHALFFYRLGHGAWVRGWKFFGRWLTQVGRFITGIEIHPGAVIGPGCFIDHGMGVVIGETAELGANVTLYQGVTLGGTSLEKGKRHPTLEDGVIVGGGAKILGPITVGRNGRVGSNAVVMKDVPADTTVVGIPAREVQRRDKRAAAKKLDFCAYGLPTDDLPDPVARSLEGIVDMVCKLRGRLESLEKEIAARDAADKTAAEAEAEEEKRASLGA